MNRLTRLKSTLLILFLAGAILGCAQGRPPITNLTAAHEYFQKICQEEYQIDVVITPLKRTLYLYIPLQEPLFGIKANKDKPQKSKISKDAQILKYSDVVYKDKTFILEYDVESSYNYKQDLGYSTPYSKRFTSIQNNILKALYRAYADLKQEDGTIASAPDFVVLVIADIKNGIEMEAILHFSDYRKVMTYAMPYEEYVKRYVTEVRGWEGIIGDTQGRHINYVDLTWPEFLAKQMNTRIKFKYLQSSLPPSEDTKGEIFQIVLQTLGSYRFRDFEGVELRDLATGETYSYQQTDMTPLLPEPSQQKDSVLSPRMKVFGLNLMENMDSK